MSAIKHYNLNHKAIIILVKSSFLGFHALSKHFIPIYPAAELRGCGAAGLWVCGAARILGCGAARLRGSGVLRYSVDQYIQSE